MTHEEAKQHVRERIAVADGKGWDRITFYFEALDVLGIEHNASRVMPVIQHPITDALRAVST